MLDGLPNTTAYTLIMRDRATWETRFAAQKTTRRDIVQFQERVAGIDSAEALLKDYRTLKFVLTAFGMEGEIGKTAVLRKLMTEDPTDPEAFANRMVDPRYRAFADAMAAWLPSDAVRARTLDTIAAGYMTRNPAAASQVTADFRSRAASVRTVGEVIGDRTLADYTLEAFGIDPAIVDDDALRRLLTEDPGDGSSYAAGQGGGAYVSYAHALAGWIGNAGVGSRLAAGIVDRWTTNAFEIDQEGSGVRAALYFRRVMGTVSSINALMSDKVLMEVVRGAYGLGDKFGLLEFEQQQRILAQKVDFAALEDPAAIDRLAQRYLLGQQGGTASSPLLALFDNSGNANTVVTLGLLLRAQA